MERYWCPILSCGDWNLYTTKCGPGRLYPPPHLPTSTLHLPHLTSAPPHLSTSPSPPHICTSPPLCPTQGLCILVHWDAKKLSHMLLNLELYLPFPNTLKPGPKSRLPVKLCWVFMVPRGKSNQLHCLGHWSISRTDFSVFLFLIVKHWQQHKDQDTNETQASNVATENKNPHSSY